jgi:hypothetical protein
VKSFGTEKTSPLMDMIAYGRNKLLVGVDVRSYISGIWKDGIFQVYLIPDGIFDASIGHAWKKENSRMHIGGNSICINKKNGHIIISYARPYLIEEYSENFILLRRFGRKASFFDDIKQDRWGNLISCGSSLQVATLPDGKILNFIRQRVPQLNNESEYLNYLDIFDENGVYLLTISGDVFKAKKTYDFISMDTDNQGNVWLVYENPYPHLEKYGIMWSGHQ